MEFVAQLLTLVCLVRGLCLMVITFLLGLITICQAKFRGTIVPHRHTPKH